MTHLMDKSKKRSRWYFGGLASAGAACVTHPLDLLKVHLQTQQEGKTSVYKSTVNIIRTQGVAALYSGLSASLLRQLTYSTVRFGVYEVGKQAIETPGQHAPFYQKLVLAGVSGAAGGIVGTPGDLINVRMQNDIKLPVDKRRNYTWAGNGLMRVCQEEGFRTLFNGCSTATARAVLMTMGQLSFYDQIKLTLMKTHYFTDNYVTHFVASLLAGAIATTMTQPLDVLKTRAMNAKPGEFKNMMQLILYTAKMGPLGFFKGYVPAFVRLAPQTILTFLFLENLRLNFGSFPPQ
ncbi:mitochondrial dicarboxylate carrier [Trichogramma pretiosum]|uniref:mitochondrial dicarboxylate carrier n=1 Tax=Trichogramma pretiosum TaxID=7493 RepID=UPI0006C96A4C|nr:mitochondrial dicarboxylate carrier [Trichogramma pretiosum]XP_014220426.1 mitochondrial dicarboxylate carrier [Trichogramma pretiosum]XP_014220427.1 mitochondrial dicarboxylate carrier [Trichogramma pretiosum]XP_023314430.1 mitochondrial dicarboxylate carrier [Trichogramma pretiosum]